MWQSLAACAFPIFVWSIVVLLNEVPALVLRFSAWEVIGVAAYVLTFDLLESLVILLALTLLAAILPARLYRSKFVAITMAVILVSSVWGVAANYSRFDLSLWTLRQFLLMLGLYAISLAVPYLLIQRFRQVEEWTVATVRRLSALSFVYLSLGCLGLIIVAIRNI